MGEKKADSILVKMAQEAVEVEERWYGDTGTQRSVAFHSLQLSGDAGILCRIVHEIEIGNVNPGDAMVRHELAATLSETFHDLLILAALTGVDLEQALMWWRGQENSKAVTDRLTRESRVNGQQRS